jgi:hypothetical protein
MPFGFHAHKCFKKLFGFQIFLTLSIPEEGYSRNVSFKLRLDIYIFIQIKKNGINYQTR